jgi:shikimate kinase
MGAGNHRRAKLADALGLTFVDTDVLVERRRLVDRRHLHAVGERRFRAIERQAIARAVADPAR